MFVDDRHNEGSAEGRDRIAPQTNRGEQRGRPMADREVPLDRHGGLSAAVHAWLDGELPEFDFTQFRPPRQAGGQGRLF